MFHSKAYPEEVLTYSVDDSSTLHTLHNTGRLLFSSHICCLISASLQLQAVLCITPAFIINRTSVCFHDITLQAFISEQLPHGGGTELT